MSEEMTYAHLGRSGLLVSRIGLGTMNFGFRVDEPSSFAVMDAAIDAGIRHRRCLRRAAVAGHEEGVRHRGRDRRLSAYHIRHLVLYRLVRFSKCYRPLRI